MKTTIFCLLSAIVLHLTSCTPQLSETVDQSTIYSSYELYYDANQDKTFAYAQFRFGNALGTLLQLSKPSAVSFNDDELVYEPVSGLYYKEYPGFKSSGTFSWKDINNKLYVNQVVIKDTINFPTINSISRSSNFELTWQGSPLTQDEFAGLLLAGPNGETPQLASTNAPNSKSIIIAKSQLQNVLVPSANIVMDRGYQPAIKQATAAGGKLSGKYRAKTIRVTIND